MQLAQVNVGRLRAPADSPRIAEFTQALELINGLADRAAGFVWRHSDPAAHPGGTVTAVDAADPLMIINLSVWTDYPHLHEFTYRTAHMQYLRRRLEWFERLEPPVTALWWVPDGERPSPAEAMRRLALLRRYGPTAQAFSIRVRFDAEGVREPAAARPRG